MKKILFALCTIAITNSFSAQIVWNETFNTLTLGNLGTDTNYGAAGQNGWYTSAPNTAPNYSNSNFTIITSDASHGQVLQITGPNSISGNKGVTKADVATAWTGRTAGNNVIQAEFDFYTGAATTSTNATTVYISNTTGSGSSAVTKILAGFSYKHSTRVPGIYFYMDPCTVLGPTYCGGAYPAGNYTLSFSDSSNNTIALNNNEWVKVGIAYNYTSGEVDILIKKADGTTVLNETLDGAAATSAVTGAYLTVNARTASSETTNTVAATSVFDNVKLSIVPTVNLLLVKDIKEKSDKNTSIYPNPTESILNIKTNTKVNAIEIFDASGRKINANLIDNKIDVSHLIPGNYILNVETKEGKLSEKFIKK